MVQSRVYDTCTIITGSRGTDTTVNTVKSFYWTLFLKPLTFLEWAAGFDINLPEEIQLEAYFFDLYLFITI